MVKMHAETNIVCVCVCVCVRVRVCMYVCKVSITAVWF
jgi:hypothetical protein